MNDIIHFILLLVRLGCSKILESASLWLFKGSFSSTLKTIELEMCAGGIKAYIADLKAWNFVKKRLQYTCFPVNITTFLLTLLSQNICEWLLLNLSKGMCKVFLQGLYCTTSILLDLIFIGFFIAGVNALHLNVSIGSNKFSPLTFCLPLTLTEFNEH